ncbi:TonB-dependent receptor [Parabacteroides sp. OttesenSCG-928-G06]|nr:TonB-dependent receptor [Parabacteroides sp. OttesenSCG-928-K15]MDL2282437.1 TonB-dependent receptor [Parabacteroides sp. OttesenSCG-928-G06]
MKKNDVGGSYASLFRKTFRIMKITTFLLICIACGLSATSYSQSYRVSINKENSSILEILKEIEKNSEFTFFFNDNQVNANKKTSVNVKDATLEEALNKILENTGYEYRIIDRQVLIKIASTTTNLIPALQQQRGKTITGTVVDERGEAVIGANVVEKGTTNGEVTDINGSFSLSVSENAILQITYIGYITQEVIVGNKNMLSIVLREDTQTLDEVVVVGYGTKKKVNLTSAVASVSSKELLQSPAANLSNTLAGRLSGVVAVNSSGAPSSGSTLSIRGQSTLNNNSPLIVVDGVPRDSFNAFDPNEIESVTVLKDGAAAAIYGARANNGVFLVTTRRGKKEKPNITYSGIASLQRPTMYPSIMSPYQYATGINASLDNAGYDRTNPSHTSRYFTDEALERFRTGQDGADWYKETFKNNSMLQNHNITLNGGTDVIRYFFSMSLLDQDGMYENINYRAYKFRSNVDVDVTSNLTLGISLDGRQENTKNPSINSGTAFSRVSRQNPTFKPYYPSGRPLNNAGEHVIEEIENAGCQKQLYNTFQGTLTANLKLDKITQGLSANANVSFGKYYNFSKSFLVPYTTYNEDENGNVISAKTQGGSGGKTYLSESFHQTYSTFLNVGLNYQRTFGKHDISGLFLYEQNGAFGDRFSASRQDFAITSKDEFFASGPNNQTVDGNGEINDARQALVGRVGYIFEGKYLFDASFRYDGSYKFPKGKRFGFFPSVSAAWRISEESFMRENEALRFITNLKLRASFAQVGNDKVNPFQFQDDYTIASNLGPFFNGAAQSLIYYGVFPNTNITWETANNYNLGLDGDLWNGLLGFEFDYFIKDTRDILWSRVRSTPDTFGRGLPNENYAQVKNKGFELTLSHHNKVNEVRYSLNFTGSYAKNKVTQIDDPANALDFQKQINRPLGFTAGYKSLGLFQSTEEAQQWMGGKQFGVTSLAGDIKYVDINGDNIIDSKDQAVLSDNNNTPRIMFGLSGNAIWKNFDFSFLLQGAAQRNIMLTSTARATFDGGRNCYAYLLDAWSPENKDAKYPLLWTGPRTVNDRNSDFWLKDAAYLRLKSITLGYTIPKFAISSWQINSLRVYVSGQNLFTWSPLEGFDPEAGSGSGAYYPQQKLFSVGVNLNF